LPESLAVVASARSSGFRTDCVSLAANRVAPFLTVRGNVQAVESTKIQEDESPTAGKATQKSAEKPIDRRRTHRAFALGMNDGADSKI
jgi:hypothetical protein